MARSDNDNDVEFELRREEQREEELGDHHARHPRHARDYGGRAHFHDEAVGYPVNSVLDQIYAVEHGHKGHAMGKHIGRSDDELTSFRSYASEGASTFETPRQMAACIRSVLDERAAEIEQWLAVDLARDAADVARWAGEDAGRRSGLQAWRAGPGKDFTDDDAVAKREFDLDVGETVGRWTRAGMEAPVGVSGVRLVLARDDTDPNGFVVRTAFPIPAEQIADAPRHDTENAEELPELDEAVITDAENPPASAEAADDRDKPAGPEDTTALDDVADGDDVVDGEDAGQLAEAQEVAADRVVEGTDGPADDSDGSGAETTDVSAPVDDAGADDADWGLETQDSAEGDAGATGADAEAQDEAAAEAASEQENGSGWEVDAEGDADAGADGGTEREDADWGLGQDDSFKGGVDSGEVEDGTAADGVEADAGAEGDADDGWDAGTEGDADGGWGTDAGGDADGGWDAEGDAGEGDAFDGDGVDGGDGEGGGWR